MEINLEGRKAQCKCGRKEPSVEVHGDHFVYRGPGSETADETCRTCGYHKVAHEHRKDRVDPRPVTEKGLCRTGFVARGPAQYDLYWCGCGNTD